MTRIGYIGTPSGSTYETLSARKDARITLKMTSSEALVGDGLDPQAIEAAVINTDSESTVELAAKIAGKRIPIYVSPPVSADPGVVDAVLSGLAELDVLTAVASPFRYAINLTQARMSALQLGLRGVSIHAWSTGNQNDDIYQACDILRYVSGDELDHVHSESGTGTTATLFRTTRGVPATLTWHTGCNASDLTVELVAGSQRFTWSANDRRIYIDGENRWSVTEKIEGLAVADIAAFITAIRTGSRSPIRCTWDDAARITRLASGIHRKRNGMETSGQPS
jgi:hypothetical protein